MATITKDRPAAEVRARALVCIHCSGGGRDTAGAYTLCALCELQGITPDTEAA